MVSMIETNIKYFPTQKKTSPLRKEMDSLAAVEDCLGIKPFILIEVIPGI